MKKHDNFLPATVDEQVQQCAQTPLHPQLPGVSLIHDLSDFYAESTEAQMLARVWERLGEYRAKSETHQQPGAARRQPPQTTRHHRRPQQRPARRWSLLAAVLCAALLVGSMVWVFHLGEYPTTMATPPARGTRTNTPQGTVVTSPGLYLGGHDGVMKVDGKTGAVVWHTTLKPAPDVPSTFSQSYANELAVAGDTVYVANQDGILSALQARDGALRWSRVLLLELGKPFVADGVLYVPTISTTDTEKGYVYAFDPGNGTERRRYQFPVSDPGLFARASVARGVLYVTVFHLLLAINLADGKQLWQQQISQQQIFNAPLVSEGIVYTSSAEISHHSANEAEDSFLYAFNATNGTRLWQSSMVNGFISNITVASHALYFGAQNHHVYALDRRNGHLLWARDIGGNALEEPVVIGGTVYFNPAWIGPTQFAGVVALHAADGSVMWRKPDISSTTYPSVVTAHGMLYIPMNSTDGTRTSHGVMIYGTIYALQASGGTVVWTSKVSMDMITIEVVP